mgnify:CR=1 FL=1
MDASKRMVNLFFAAATLLAWVTFSKFYQSLFGVLKVRDTHLLGKEFTLTTAIAAATAIVLFVWVWKHPRLKTQIDEVGDELVKVTWPDWEETRNHSKITIIVTMIMAWVLIRRKRRDQ